jgi:formylglycine-generating enzyme required for sulfatase activity
MAQERQGDLLMLTTLLLAMIGAGDAPRPAYPMWDGKESVADYGKRAKLAPTLTLDLGEGVRWEGVLVPAGAFVLGSPPGEPRTKEEEAAEKQHKVRLTLPYWIGKYELTQAQYARVMGVNPSKTKGDDLPVGNVTFKDAQEFCDRAGNFLGRSVLVPTDAQWEYACRAGTTTAYCNGNTIADLDKVGWHGGNSGGKVHPVGKLAPNAWGIYDMHGNIRELVADLYSDDPQPDATDPTGPTDGDPKNHIIRGGAFTANAAFARNCRSGSRRPTERAEVTGFRIIVPAPAPK